MRLRFAKMPILAKKKNHLFRWSSIWSWRVCRQAKLPNLRHRKPAHIHWKADVPRTSHGLVRILAQRHNRAIILRKWEEVFITVNSDRYWAMLNEFLFTKIEEKDIGNIWFQHDGAACHTVDVLNTVFEDRIVSLRADVVWPSRSSDLTLLVLYL